MSSRDKNPQAKRFFAPGFVGYEPGEVRMIRARLGETREQFARRFFVETSTIKAWESTGKKRREVLGAAARVMYWAAVEANQSGAAVNNLIRRKKMLPDKMGTDLVVADVTPITLLDKAMSNGASMEQLEKFMDLYERHEKNEARKAYVTAMAEFKSNPPKINKDKHVQYKTSKGKTDYNHASLGNVSDTITTALSKCGLSAAWTTSQDSNGITVTCTITHNLGYSEKTSLTSAPDQSGGKNAIQAIGSTISYLERYTILALTGLATHDQDDDGAAAGVAFISLDQATLINDMIKEVGADKDKFLQFMKCGSVSQIPAKHYATAISALEAKRASN